MIKVTVINKLSEKNEIAELEIDGHAESGPYGHDLVCAGVSSIVIGGINALKQCDLYDIVVKSGYIHLKIPNGVKMIEHDQVVLQTIVTQLKTIEETAPKNILVTKRYCIA